MVVRDTDKRGFVMTQDLDLGPTKMVFGDDGIVRIMNEKNAELGLKDAQANVRALEQLGQGKRLCIWVDASQIKSMSRDARRFFAGQQAAQVVQAQAILVSSPVGRVISNFFLGINKPPFPTQLFTDKEKSLKWLLEYV